MQEMQDCNVIAKGSYSNFRFNDFVSVRQYLLIREKGKKYLIMKLSNDAMEPVTGLKLAVEQLDVRGERIETSHVEWNDVLGKPGEKFIPQNKIPLRESCVEVKIRLVGATYGNYTYAVKSNELVVTYEKKPKKSDSDYSYYTGGERFVANERKFKIPRAIIAMTLVVLLCVMAATVVQLFRFKKEETQFTWKSVKYEFLQNDKREGSPIRVIGCSALGGNIVVPKEVEGYPVQEISSQAFRDKDNIRSVKIFANVALEDYAFSGCENLESVELAGPTKVGENTFFQCNNLKTVKATNLEKIEEKAFFLCSSLETLELTGEEKTLSLGKKAFADCRNLKTLRILQTVDYSNATDCFLGVENVTELVLKNYNSKAHESRSDKKIADLFSGTEQTFLRTLSIDDIDVIPENFCQNFSALETVTLNGVKDTTLGDSAFENCQNFVSLNIAFEEEGQAVTGVGNYAFYKTKISSFNGSNLEYIGEGAFADNQFLTEVNLENNQTLMSLGGGAFKNCSALKSIYIPETVSILPESTFENCGALTTVNFSDMSLLLSIDKRAMYNCNQLSYINMPNTVTAIGEEAYANCSGATTILLSRTLQTIGEKAFENCSSANTFDAPNTVTFIGMGALEGCSKIEELTVPFVGCSKTLNTHFAAVFGGDSYENYDQVPRSLKKVTVSGDCNIENNAFFGLNQIKQVQFLGDVQYIGDQAFAYCGNLREIHLSKELKHIGENAFENCHTLFEIWNPSDLSIERGSLYNGGIAQNALAVYGIGDERLENKTEKGFFFLKATEGWYVTDYLAKNEKWTLPASFQDANGQSVTQYTMTPHLFEGWEEVESLSISGGVKTMGEYAFANCPNLKTVTYAKDVLLEEIASNTFGSCSSLNKLTIDASANISAIRANALSYCQELKTVTLPNALREIDSEAFKNCAALTSLILPNQLKTIGDSAFDCCASLSALTIPNSVTSIGYGAFKETQSLKTLSVPFIGGSASENRYMAYVFGTSEYFGNSTVTEIKITATDEMSINDYAFNSFTSLKKVVFSGSVTAIGANAFCNCSNFTSITYNGTVQRIGDYAFASSGLKSFAFNNGLQQIGTGAFQYTALRTVNLPASLTAMGEYVFQGSLVQTVDLQRVGLTNLPSYTFANCTSLKTCSMNESSLQQIGDHAFENTVLTSIVFPSSLTKIGQNAFQYSALKTVDLSQSLETIGGYAFSDCPELETVWLRSAWTIESGAFNNCPNLHEIYNLTSLSIKRGDYANGQIAYNAIIVHTSASASALATQTVDGFTYKYSATEGEACLYSCSAIPQTLHFQAVSLGEKSYSNYWIWRDVFAYNDTLQELNTGVVTEIGSCAFISNFALRKVTIGSAIGADKVASDAFASCEKLWEVHDNNANYIITAGGYECGQVGYYAMAINQEITYKTESDCEFMYYGGTWYLYDCHPIGNVKLPTMNEQYVLFKHPKLYDYPFDNVSSDNYVLIPKSVKNIQAGALGSNYITVYYEGTQSEWSNITKGSTYYDISVYYLNDCVHNSDKGTSYWRYVNGQPSTADSELTQTTISPTCKTIGLEKYSCDVCKQVFKTVTLERVDHAFDSVTGACTWCKQVLVEDGSLGELLSIENASTYKYLIDKNGVVYSDWREDYGSFTSILDLTATKDLTLSFKARLVSSLATVKITVNGTVRYTMSGTQTKTITLELNQGDKVSVSMECSRPTTKEQRIYIEDVNVKAKPENIGEENKD